MPKGAFFSGLRQVPASVTGGTFSNLEKCSWPERKSGKGLGSLEGFGRRDYRMHAVTLVTRNIKDFEHIGLF